MYINLLNIKMTAQWRNRPAKLSNSVK